MSSRSNSANNREQRARQREQNRQAQLREAEAGAVSVPPPVVDPILVREVLGRNREEANGRLIQVLAALEASRHNNRFNPLDVDINNMNNNNNPAVVGAVRAALGADMLSPNNSRAGGAGAHQPAHGTNKRKACNMYGPETVESWASSEVEQDTFAFLWTIKNFTVFSSSSGTGSNGTDEVKSPIFRGGSKSSHSWQIKMNPRKKVDEVEYFAVHLILSGFGDDVGTASQNRKLKVRFQISILDIDGRPAKQAGSQTMSVCEFKKYSVWGYDKFLGTNDLLSPSRRLLDEDTLKIHCRIWIEGDVKHKQGVGGASANANKVSDEEVKRRRCELLTNDLQSLLVDTSFADVALSTNTKTFMAHKALLSARSTVFKAMFSSSMLEAKNNTVEIHDFDEEVVKGMLEHMYTGQTSILNERATDLLQIAEKYYLMGLKEDCEETIAENLTVDNAAEVLVLAHLHNAKSLKPRVIDYINRNKEDVKKTPSFKRVAAGNSAVFVDLYLSQ